MNWNEKDIDQLFKNSSEKLSFEYKDVYWKEMEALLPPKKKDGFFWLFTASSFAVLLLIGIFYSPVKVEHSSIANTSKEQKPKEKYVPSFSQEKKERKKHSDLHSNNTQNATPQKRETNTLSNNSLEKSSKNTPDLNVSKLSVTPSQNTEKQLKNSRLDKKIQAIEKNRLLFETNLFSTEEIKNKNNIKNSPTNQKKVISVNRLPLREWKTKQEKNIIPIHPATKTPPIQTRLYIEGALGISQSLITPNKKIGGLYGLGFGVQIRKSRWNFTIGVNGTIGSHNDIRLTRTAKQYSFGSTEVRYDFYYRQLFSVEGNFSVGALFGKHELSLGISPSFMVSNKIELKRGLKGGVVEESSFLGYMEGINRWNLKPTFGYAYHFNRGWQVGVRGRIQLFNTFQPTFIQQENTHFPVDGQIFLRKTFNLKRK